MNQETSLDQAAATYRSLAAGDAPAAGTYYDDVLFPLIVARAREAYQPTAPALPYDQLYLTCGTSPWPLALTLLVVRWREAYVLHTPETQAKYEDVVRLLRAQGEKEVPQRVDVGPASAEGVYRRIHDHLPADWAEKRIGIDCTGGTKSMVAGASLVAPLLQADLLYVDSEFDVQLRKPQPGSERVVLLEDPYEIFGDLKEREARNLAAAGNWAAAAALLEELAGRVISRERHPLADLAAAYACWDALDFTAAAQYLDQVSKRTAAAERERSILAFDATGLAIVGQQREACRSLAASLEKGDEVKGLLVDAGAFRQLWGWLRAYRERRFAMGQYDLIALLDYRTIELMSQRRLAQHGLDSAAPDFSQLELTDQQVAAAAKTMYGKKAKQGLATLPSGPLGLQAGLQVLLALGDGWVSGEGVVWGRLLGQLDQRNHGLFAHGFKPTDQDAAKDFGETVDGWCDRFCKVEGWPARDAVIEPYRFLPLP